jgi:NAD(P)H:quinone oxidoreductase type IV
MKGSTRLRGFRSAVAYVPGTKRRRLVAMGPAGPDESQDGGATWSKPRLVVGALDPTGKRQRGALVGKPGGVFVSTATQHGGQESTILSFHTYLLHQGMLVVGLPYAFQGQMRMDEITGGSPYGASTIAGGDGARKPSQNELEAVAYQAKRLVEIGHKLKA